MLHRFKQAIIFDRTKQIGRNGSCNLQELFLLAFFATTFSVGNLLFHNAISNSFVIFIIFKFLLSWTLSTSCEKGDSYIRTLLFPKIRLCKFAAKTTQVLVFSKLIVKFKQVSQIITRTVLKTVWAPIWIKE